MTPLLLVAGLLTLAVLASILWPALRRTKMAPAGNPELAVYRDQLGEIERDLERGLIRPEEAAAARLEVERRLLRAAESGREVEAGRPARGSRAVVAAAAALVLALTLVLYGRLGAPSLPDRPLAGRQQELAQAGGEIPQVREMVAGLEKRLQAEPKDLQGWLMLGRSKAVLDDAPGALAAFREAQKLAPDDPTMLGGLGEALVTAEGGVVTPEASGLFERLQRVGNGDPRPDYYLGLGAAQAGDNRKALELWRKVLAGAPADAPWRGRVEEAIRTAARELGTDPDAILAAVPKPAPPPGPTQADVAAADKLTPEQRTEFVRGMVGRLEAKLEADGSDAVGWLRLAQARLMLGDRDKGRAAYERGLALHPNDAALLKGYASLLLQPPQQTDGLPQVGEDAAQLYERAAAAAPDDPEPQWYLGVRALQKGLKNEARDRWRRVLARLEPSQPDYAVVKERLDSLGG